MRVPLYLCLALVIALLAGCGGGGGGVAPSGPVISNMQVNPTSMYYGGPVEVTATVTDDIEVSSVSAEASAGSATPLTKSMSTTDGTNYKGTITIPANTTGKDKTYSVKVKAVDNTGNRSESSAVKVVVKYIDVPPPPPSN